MPRLERVVLPGVAHHVTQRGNDRRDVFLDDADREAYLSLLAAHAKRYGLVVHGYCLMPNHVHAIATPTDANALGMAFGRTHVQYAQHFNRRHDRSGHLWQGRFFSCPMDEAHAIRALAYVELNPVRSGIATHAHDFPWSSAALRCGKRRTDPLVARPTWPAGWTAREWTDFLRTMAADTANTETIRRQTWSGRALGDDAFLDSGEAALGRALRSKPVGRPHKPKPAEAAAASGTAQPKSREGSRK